MHSSYTREHHIKQQLQFNIPIVFHLIVTAINSRIISLQQRALTCLRTWQYFEVNISQINSYQLLQPVLHQLQSDINTMTQSSHIESQTAQSIESIVEIVTEAIEARVTAVEQLVAACAPIISLLFALQPVIEACRVVCCATVASAFASQSVGSLSVDVAAFLSLHLSILLQSVCTANIEWIAAGSADALHLVSLLSSFACYPFHHHSVSQIAWPFFISLQDLPSASRHPQLRQPLFIQLISALIPQSAYPNNFKQWDDSKGGFAGDRDTFILYRLELDQVLFSAFGILQEQYYQLCMQQLHVTRDSWSQHEAVVNALCAVSAPMQEGVDEEWDLDALTAAMIPPFHNLLQHDIHKTHPILIESTCRLIHGYAFWLCDQQALIQPAVQYLLIGAPITEEAGPGFSSLLSFSAAMLIQHTQTVESLIQTVTDTQYWERLSKGNQVHLLSGLTVLINHTPHSTNYLGYLHVLITPIINSLQNVIKQHSSSPSAVLSPLLFASISLSCSLLAAVLEPKNGDLEDS